MLATAFENKLRARYPAVKIELTGETPLNFDIRKASADDVQHGETLVIPATLILLLIAFGSLVAAVIPLAVGQLAIATTMAIDKWGMKPSGQLSRDNFRFAAFDAGCSLQMALGVKRKWKKCKNCDKNYPGYPEMAQMHQTHDLMQQLNLRKLVKT